MTSPTETEIQNIRLVLAGAKAPEEFGWGAADVAAWGELAAGDPVAFVTLGVWSRRFKEVDEEAGEERHAARGGRRQGCGRARGPGPGGRRLG